MRRRISALADGLARRTWLRATLLTLYYAAVVAALAVLYGRGHHTPPPFIYQGF